MATQARPISVTGSGIVYSGFCVLRGFWILASATAATITLYDNTSASGLILAQWITTATNQDKEFDFQDGVRCDNGLYLNVSTGTLAGSVRLG
jgi:hypothetical protein